MKNQNFNLIGITLTIFLSISSLSAIFFIDRHIFIHDTIKIISDEDVTLKGTYYEGEIAKGIIFLEGFGADQVALRNLATQILTNQYFSDLY